MTKDNMSVLLYTEHDIQVQVITWTEMQKQLYPDLAYIFAIPNGAKLPYRRNAKGKRVSPEAMKLIAEGMKSGVPDLMLPVPRWHYLGMFLELKREDGKVSENQSHWLGFLKQQGYYVDVAFSFEQATKSLLYYVGLPERTIHEGNYNE